MICYSLSLRSPLFARRRNAWGSREMRARAALAGCDSNGPRVYKSRLAAYVSRSVRWNYFPSRRERSARVCLARNRADSSEENLVKSLFARQRAVFVR